MKIIVDTREKNPYAFFLHSVERLKLDEGDYTCAELLEYEKKTGDKTLRIERKASPSELATNLGKNFKTFEAEMRRLQPYKRKVLLLEFSEADMLRFPFNLPKSILYRKVRGRLKRRIKMTGKFMAQRLEYLQKAYDIEIIFADSKDLAEQKALAIMENALNELI